MTMSDKEKFAGLKQNIDPAGELAQKAADLQ